MQNISLWALLHPIKARIILTITNLALALISIWLGITLFSHDIHLPKYLIGVGLSLFFGCWMIYPIRRARYRFWKFNYVRQKVLDVIVICCGILMITTMSNRDAHVANREVNTQVSAVPVMLLSKERMASEQVDKSEKLSWGKLKKSMRSSYKAYVKAKKESKDVNSETSIFVVCLFTALLLLLTAALSCSISCSGSNEIAIIIFVLSWSIILAGAAALIRDIKLKKKNNYQKAEE